MRKNHRVLKARSLARVNKGTEFQVERMHIFGRDFTIITRRRNGKAVATLQLSDPYDKVSP